MDKKLSEIILDMIQPYNDGDFTHLKTLVSIASLSWNLTIVPDNLNRETNELLSKISEDDEYKDMLQELIDKFKQYKLSYYKYDNRLIADYQIVGDEKSYTLNIASALFGSTVNKNKKIGRNEPCPCESGKKYKKCCGTNA
jgi:uncharacterized protein YecA (UPF0149 family)